MEPTEVTDLVWQGVTELLGQIEGHGDIADELVAMLDNVASRAHALEEDYWAHEHREEETT